MSSMFGPRDFLVISGEVVGLGEKAEVVYEGDNSRKTGKMLRQVQILCTQEGKKFATIPDGFDASVLVPGAAFLFWFTASMKVVLGGRNKDMQNKQYACGDLIRVTPFQIVSTREPIAAPAPVAAATTPVAPSGPAASTPSADASKPPEPARMAAARM